MQTCNEQTKSSLQYNDATKYVQNIAAQLTVHVKDELYAFVIICMGKIFKLMKVCLHKIASLDIYQ